MLATTLLLLGARAGPGPSLSTEAVGEPIEVACSPGTPSATLNLDPFYENACAVAGVPIVVSADVADAAVVAATEIVGAMMSPLSEVEREGLRNVGSGLLVGVIGENEVTSDMPEYADLNALFPRGRRGRGHPRARGDRRASADILG